MARNVFYIPARNDELQKNVAIYCRVSSGSREQLQSLSAQISALTRAVSNVSQWRLADVFIDIGSAKGGAQRQEFNRMIAECEKHNLSVILTKSISRFGRDTVETLDAIKRIKAAGVQIIFDEEHVDTDELDSDLMISIIEAVAQAENESRSENIRIGLERKTALGISGHMRRKLYGYKKNPSGELEVDEEQAKVVRDVFRWYLDGESTLGIIKKLHEAGIPSPQGKEKWSKGSVDNMLSNHKYTGTVELKSSLHDGAIYQIKDGAPPIITESEFRSVQEARAKRSNVEIDEFGEVRRKSTKYSSKAKKDKK